MSVFNVKLQTLSPVHIGDGNELRQGFDFMVRGNATYRLNEDAILQAKESQVRPDRAGHYPTPGQLLTEADYSNGNFFRYALRGAARSGKMDARVKSFIKDVYDRPYIPGSSLKGALRTALAWLGWGEVIHTAVNRDMLGGKKEWAGQDIEKKLFRPIDEERKKDPNHDLLRALHISDLIGNYDAHDSLWVLNAQVLKQNKREGSREQAPIELECLGGSLEFTGSITIDETLFSALAEKQLNFKSRKIWLDELVKRTNQHSFARIEKLASWFAKQKGCEKIAEFYATELLNRPMTENQALVQFGWGAGWDGKTFWTHLQKDPDFFEFAIVGKYRLDIAKQNSKRHSGDPFPQSRRAVLSVKDKVTPLRPFGWVLLELEKVR